MSGLNQMEMRLLSIHKAQVVFKAGMAMAEGKTRNTQTLHRDVLSHVTLLIGNIKDPNLLAEKCSLPHVRENKIDLFLTSLKATYTQGMFHCVIKSNARFYKK